MMTRRFFSLALAAALLLALTPATWAKGKGFKEIVKHLETSYRAKKTKIPMLGLANFAVKIIRPAGVKGFKVATFEGQDFAPRAGETPFVNVMRTAYLPEKGWKPLIQTNSKRDGLQRSYIFFKENKQDVEVALATLGEHEATVVEVKFSPDKMVQFLDNPRIMGISLGGSLRGQMDKSIAGVMTGNINSSPGSPSARPPRTPSEPTGNGITVVDRTGAPARTSVTVTATATAAPATPRLALKAPADPAANDENNPPVTAPNSVNDTASAKLAPAVVTPPDPNAIRIETRLVNLNVRALNKTGLPLTDLKPEDFQVFEDEVKQEVAHFKPVSAPVNLLVLLDMSGSTQRKHKTMIESVRKFIDLLPANDKMSIVAFTRRYYRLSTFTNDKTVLKAAVEKISKIQGGTAYYDALVEALNDLSHLGDARKAIVVLTDGEDESMLGNGFGSEPSGFSFQQMLERAAEADVTVYPIYFSGTDAGRALNLVFSGPQFDRQSDRRTQARKQLQAVADQTGGEVINAQSEENLASAYARVAAELHTLYSLAYSPDKLKHDGAFRKISVNVNRAGALAKTRKGYYDK